MKVSEMIPLTPQPWCRNPDGYVHHQIKLRELARWLESQDIPIRLPEDRGGWDRGVDLIVGDTRIDLKGFGLRRYSRSFTWSATYYEGRPAPVWDSTETDWFVHPRGDVIGSWLAAPLGALTTSRYRHEPYYPSSQVVTVHKLAQDVFTSRPN